LKREAQNHVDIYFFLEYHKQASFSQREKQKGLLFILPTSEEFAVVFAVEENFKTETQKFS